MYILDARGGYADDMCPSKQAIILSSGKNTSEM
jgi:hypothetical protein